MLKICNLVAMWLFYFLFCSVFVAFEKYLNGRVAGPWSKSMFYEASVYFGRITVSSLSLTPPFTLPHLNLSVSAPISHYLLIILSTASVGICTLTLFKNTHMPWKTSMCIIKARLEKFSTQACENILTTRFRDLGVTNLS